MKAENEKLVAANTAFKQDLEIGEVCLPMFVVDVEINYSNLH